MEGCGKGGGRGRVSAMLRGLSTRALVWGDVDPHGSGLGARYANGSTIVVEVRSSTLFECRGGWVEDAYACHSEVVRSSSD